jgi:hypothetical protein
MHADRMKIAFVLVLLLGCASAPQPEASPQFNVDELLAQAQASDDASVVVQTPDGPRGHLPLALANEKPHLIWNTFLKVVAVDPETLAPKQRPAHFALVYDGEVQNGGHHQFFENSSRLHTEEILASLNALRLPCQAAVLQSAIDIWKSRPRDLAETADDFTVGALQDEYHAQDGAYYRCSPTTNEGLERHLKAHQDDFVILDRAQPTL